MKITGERTVWMTEKIPASPDGIGLNHEPFRFNDPKELIFVLRTG